MEAKSRLPPKKQKSLQPTEPLYPEKSGRGTKERKKNTGVGFPLFPPHPLTDHPRSRTSTPIGVLEVYVQDPDKVIPVIPQSSMVTVSMPNHHGNVVSKKSSLSHPREPTPMEC